MNMLVHHIDWCIAVKGRDACKKLVENNAQRVEVTACVAWVALCLFG